MSKINEIEKENYRIATTLERIERLLRSNKVSESKGEAVIPEKKEMLSIVRVEFDQEMQKTVVILSNGATLEGLVKVDASIDVNEGNLMCSVKALVYDCNA